MGANFATTLALYVGSTDMVQGKYSFGNEKIAIKGFMVGSCSVLLSYYAKKKEKKRHTVVENEILAPTY